MSVINKTKQAILADKVVIANTFLSRLVGLLGRSKLNQGEGLYLTNCQCVHMFGMRFSIDVVFLDQDNKVVGIEHNLLPFRISGFYRKAISCLELPAGTVLSTNTELGDELTDK